MDEERKRHAGPPAVGGISLLVVFAVLCLTVFALLSLSTVRADDRLGAASAQAVADYYAADSRAQEILALLRSGRALPEDIQVTATHLDYADRSETVYAYTCPISDTQELQVAVRLNGGRYTVLRWQAAAVGEWEIDNSLHVWVGEST